MARSFREASGRDDVQGLCAARLRATIRSNIEIMRYLTNRINQSQDFVRLAPAPLSVVCFQYLTTDTSIQPDQKYLDELNTRLLDRLEKDGRVFLSWTKS